MRGLLGLILSAVSWPSLISRALGGGPPGPLPKLAALAPAATVPAMAAVPVAARRSWRLALALAVPAAVLACWQLPPRRPCPGIPAGQDTNPTLRVLTVNIEGGKAQAELLVDVLAAGSVDVFVAQEVTPAAAARLSEAGLAGILPHGVVDARPGHAGTAIWSRVPLRAAEPISGLACAAPRAVLTAGGQPVTITAVHVLAPVNNHDGRWRDELALLGSRAPGDDGPELMAGDFNATRDHHPFRRLLAAGYVDCADAAGRRHWPAFTWPSGPWRLPVMRLDHVLAARDHFIAADCRTVLVPGTDHRGVLATVQVTGRVNPAERGSIATERRSGHA